MELPALLPYPNSKDALTILITDDAMILGNYEELLRRFLKSIECWKKLEQAGVLRHSEN